MLQGERSLTRRWWCCNFDKWSNWSWETPLHSTLLVAPSSPTLQAEEGAEQSWKEGVSKILCNQPAFLVFILLLFPFPSFLPRKRGPAVKWCNPDAVTMLSVNHQGCDLRRKKNVYVFHELKVVLICIWRKRKTPQLVWCKSSTWGLTLHYLGGSKALNPAFFAPGTFINYCQHDLALDRPACLPFG